MREPGEFEEGEQVSIEYESSRTGNPQEVTAEVIEAGGLLFRAKDESRNRTIVVDVLEDEVSTVERRGHLLSLGPLESVERTEVEDDD